MKSVFATILLLLGACGALPQYGVPSEVVVNTADERVIAAVAEFYARANAAGMQPRNTKLEINDNLLGEFDIGACWTMPADRGIYLRHRLLEEKSDNVVKWVVMHELGHCALGMKHTNYGLMQSLVPVGASDKEFKRMFCTFFNDCEEALK